MITAQIATTLDRSELMGRSERAALINASAYYSFAPWKYTALMKLHKLEHAPSSQEKAENLSVSSDAAMFARTILGSLEEENLPTPSVCPASGGSVAMIWTLGLKQLEAIFGPDRSGSFVLSDGDEIVGDGEMFPNDAASFSGALEKIVAA